MYTYPKALNSLIEILSQLPSVGPKSAVRIAITLASRRTDLLESLANSAEKAATDIKKCNICNSLVDSDQEICNVCSDSGREKNLMIVESVIEMQVIENERAYRGYYHILGGLVSPMRGQTLESLGVEKIVDRIQSEGFSEIILAMPPSVEGDTTALMLKEFISNSVKDLNFSRLGRGIPTGAQLEYLDPQTLKHSITNKSAF